MYSRADLLRILHITPRQLANWERIGLVTSAEGYTFADLLEIKKVRDLCAKKVRPAVIRQSLQAMQKQVAGMDNPLLEATAFSNGHRVAFRHDGKLLEPIAGQFVLDFSSEQKVIARTPVVPLRPEAEEPDVAVLFSRGIALEENPSTHSDAIATYLKVIEREPTHAAAHINLGTLYYNRQDYVLAERYYRKAIEVDPRYALAYFDLGNVLDETGRLPDAIRSYNSAIALAPTYADAHYNLALAYDKARQPRKALRHWQAYARLDAIGPWAIHARNQIKKILANEQLRVVAKKK